MVIQSNTINGIELSVSFFTIYNIHRQNGFHLNKFRVKSDNFGHQVYVDSHLVCFIF